MAKKDNSVTFTVTLDLDHLAGMSVAERKGAIEQAFAANKELAINAVTKKLS